MSEWTATTIGEVAEIFDGPHATPKKMEAGPWFLSISSLNRGQLDLAQSAHLSEDDFVRWTRRVTPKGGDLLFSYETRLGEAALMPEGLQACLGRRMGILRPKKEKVNPRFLLYAYLGPNFQNTIQERRVHGATVERIPLTEMDRWPISIPSLKEQEAIADLLGALDDKIAINNRITATSKEMLETLSLSIASRKSQHVQLREIIELKYGKALKASDRTPGKVPIFGGNGISGSHNRSLASGPGIIIGRKGANAGSVSWSSVDFWPIDTAFYVTPRDSNLPMEFLFLLLRTVPFRGDVGDSAIPGLNRDIALSIKVWVPEEEAATELARQAGHHFELQEQVEEQSRTLAELRDTLLPKLMSGQIRVRDTEKVVEDAV